MCHQAGTSTGTTTGGGSSIFSCHDHSSVSRSRWANRTAARLSAGFTPTVSVMILGEMVTIRSLHRCHSSRSTGSVTSAPDRMA